MMAGFFNDIEWVFMSSFIEIPWDALPKATLMSVVEEFVNREGTDYGDVDVSMSGKVEQVIHGIKNKHYVIIFDEEMQCCQIAEKTHWDKEKDNF